MGTQGHERDNKKGEETGFHSYNGSKLLLEMRDTFVCTDLIICSSSFEVKGDVGRTCSWTHIHQTTMKGCCPQSFGDLIHDHLFGFFGFHGSSPVTKHIVCYKVIENFKCTF